MWTGVYIFLCYIFSIMSRWFVGFAVIVAAIILVTCQQQYSHEKTKRVCQEQSAALSMAPIDNSHSANQGKECDDRPTGWHVLLAWPEAITTWALIATLFVVCWQATLMAKHAKHFEDLANATLKQAVLMEDTAKRQLRAYMVLRRGRILLLEGGGLRLMVEIVNCGQTPAYDFQGTLRSGISVYPRTESWEPPQLLQQSKGIIGSDRAHYAGGILPYPQKAIEALRSSPNQVLFITGRFTYLDIFKEPHPLRLQLVVGGPMGIQLDTDESGNKFYVTYTDVEGNEGD